MNYKIEYNSVGFPLWKPNFLTLYPEYTTELLLLIRSLKTLPKEVTQYISYLVLQDVNTRIGEIHETGHY